MRNKHYLIRLFFCVFLLMAGKVMAHGGEDSVFHKFTLQGDYGGGTGEGLRGTWELQGWVGGDENKLWIQSEGKHADGKLEDGNLWLLYSRSISDFWDVQGGYRQDIKPSVTEYFVLGVHGLAPYFFETAAHLFVSNRGGLTADLRTANNFYMTQKLVFRPYAELKLSAFRVDAQDVGTGITEVKFGLQTRYEISKKIAPYIDLRYGTYLGNTKSVTKDDAETSDDFVAALGMQFMF